MKGKGKNRLTTALIIAVNVFFVFALFIAEFQYISSIRRQTIAQNEENFEITNASLVSITDNYLLGESRLCRSWSNHLNSHAHTMEEAIEFVRESITDDDVMGHIVYKTKTNLTGYSTKASSVNPNNYFVDYGSISGMVFTQKGEGVRVSSSYINPINGSPSIAFYNDIKLRDPDDPTLETDAYLLRVVLRDNIRTKWVFPSGAFDNLQVTIMDKDGNYIIAGKSFKNSNFFEFYKSYNKSSDESITELKKRVTTENGLMKMYNAVKEECYIAYSQFNNPTDWVLLTYTPAVDITTVPVDWLLISILGAGLLALFIIDLLVMLRLNKNLSETAKEAESASKAKTHFLSTMSHDIRTPMNAIIGFTELAKNEPNNPASTQDALRKIELASSNLLTLINDILDLSKIESGRLSINPLDFPIVDLFDNLVNISQPMAKSKHIDFSFRVVDFENEWLYADKLRISQVFSNLLSNAMKYTMEDGKVSVDVMERPSDKEGCTKLIFVVADTGIGMSPEYVAKMYEPFTRATDSRVNTIQGTGLGLAITKQMVDLMGGSIECQSEVGKGTTFTVSLDIPVSSKKKEEMQLPGTNVLLIDGDELTLKAAAGALSVLGAKAETASSATNAAKLLKEKADQYQVIIVEDRILKGEDNVLAKEIKVVSKKESPLVLMSGYDWSEVENETKEWGFAGFISKPYFESKLFNKINDLVNADAKEASSKEEENVFEGVKVLVVEDNEINWEIISALLETYGIESERAENGKEGLDLLSDSANDGKWDIVFMDLQMPVMNGLEATKAIRRLDRDYPRNVPILAMTADAFSENVTECLEAGMNGHIAKPIDLDIVLNEIRKNLKKKD